MEFRLLENEFSKSKIYYNHQAKLSLNSLSSRTRKSLANFPKAPFTGNLFFPSRRGVGVEKSMNDAFNKYFSCFAQVTFAN